MLLCSRPDSQSGPHVTQAGSLPRLTRRRIIGSMAGGATALAFGHSALANDAPEEIGLPDSGHGLGGVGPRGGAGAGTGSAPVATAPAEVATVSEPVVVNGQTYTAYTDTFLKQGQWQLYTCEFDVAYSIMMTFGVESTLDDLLSIVGFDNPFDPYAVDGPNGPVIYGGDIGQAFCGDLMHNTFAKTRGSAMRRAFEGFGFDVETVSARSGVERGLTAGSLMWMKTTVDFAPWVPTRWVTPDGTTYPTVYDNDHCVAAIGFNDDVVVIRDCLGPTNTNWDRPYEYEVPWDLFMDCWSAGGHDGLLVAPQT